MANNNVAIIYFQREVAHTGCKPSEPTMYTHLEEKIGISLHSHFHVITKQRHVCKILMWQHYGPQECHYIDRKTHINSLDESAASRFRLQEGHPPWRWMQLVFPKQEYVVIKVHSEISQKTVILPFNAWRPEISFCVSLH